MFLTRVEIYIGKPWFSFGGRKREKNVKRTLKTCVQTKLTLNTKNAINVIGCHTIPWFTWS